MGSVSKGAVQSLLAFIALVALAGSGGYLYSQFHTSTPGAGSQAYKAIEYLHDPQSTMLREYLNPSWEPRFYLLSKDLVLKNIQRSKWVVPEFVKLT